MRILRVSGLLLIFLSGVSVGQFLPTSKDLHIHQVLEECRDWAAEAGIPERRVLCELDVYDSGPWSGVAIVKVAEDVFLESYSGGWLHELGVKGTPLFTRSPQSYK